MKKPIGSIETILSGIIRTPTNVYNNTIIKYIEL